MIFSISGTLLAMALLNYPVQQLKLTIFQQRKKVNTDKPLHVIPCCPCVLLPGCGSLVLMLCILF